MPQHPGHGGTQSGTVVLVRSFCNAPRELEAAGKIAAQISEMEELAFRDCCVGVCIVSSRDEAFLFAGRLDVEFHVFVC